MAAVGGLVGVLLGILIARLVAAAANWTTLITPWSVVLATGVALIVGLLSGFYPARRASLLDPIESLRYE